MKELLDKTGTRYRLVIMVAQRAKDLFSHSKPLIDNTEGDKAIAIALKEINQGKIIYRELKKHGSKKTK